MTLCRQRKHSLMKVTSGCQVLRKVLFTRDAGCLVQASLQSVDASSAHLKAWAGREGKLSRSYRQVACSIIRNTLTWCCQQGVESSLSGHYDLVNVWMLTLSDCQRCNQKMPHIRKQLSEDVENGSLRNLGVQFWVCDKLQCQGVHVTAWSGG